MRKILGLVFCAVFAFLVFFLTGFGWRFWSGKAVYNNSNNSLAEVLKSHVYKLSADIGERSVYEYENLQAAEKYISQQFASYGYKVEFQDYRTQGKTVKNIIALKSGIDKPQELIIVGAHYDSCFNPGADDNASGVAGVLELARFLSDKNLARSIKFIAFVNEEPPFFQTEDMGSRVYARGAKRKAEDIKSVIILEMVGYYTDEPNSQRYPPLLGPFYPNKGNFITVVGNFNSRWLANKIVSDFKKQSTFPIESLVGPGFIPGVDFSDHWSFWKEGYPAVMVTDTAFYRNSDYHTVSDTYEKLNYQAASEVVSGFGKVLIGLANK